MDRRIVRVEGQGLHSARRSAVVFERHDGPLVLRQPHARGVAEVSLDRVRVVDTSRSTTIASVDAAEEGVRVATVEHLFAALAGLGVHEGLVVTIEGPEVPLVDGGAKAFAEAVVAVGARASSSRLRVVEDGAIAVGTSTYEFRRSDDVSLEVAVDFGDARFDGTARWDGDAHDFTSRIAAARTFGFEHEVMDLLAKGLASHVAPESVVVVCKDRVLSSGSPFRADEPVRHKLLDAMGDLFVYGGPPRGHVRAFRPGHHATHEAMARAFDLGLVARVTS